MFRENTTIAQGLIIAVFSMIVVFVILLVISYLIDLIAFLTKKSNAKKTVSNQCNQVALQNKTPDEEEAAAVVAAIAAYLGRDNFTVKTIENKSNNSSWNVSAQINSTK